MARAAARKSTEDVYWTRRPRTGPFAAQAPRGASAPTSNAALCFGDTEVTRFSAPPADK